MASEAIVIGKPLRVNGAKPIDYLSGPYASVAAAVAAIPAALRYIGMTVTIVTGNTPVEYWFSGGTGDANLIPKSSGGGGGDGFKATEVASIPEDTTVVLEEFYTNGGYNMVVVTGTQKAYIRYGESKWFSFAVGILGTTPSTTVGIGEVNYLSMT